MRVDGDEMWATSTNLAAVRGYTWRWAGSSRVDRNANDAAVLSQCSNIR
jgi:hypothetical protein